MSYLIQAIDASDNTISCTISDVSDISVIERQPHSAKPHTHYQLASKFNVVDRTLSPSRDEWDLANLSVTNQLDFADSDAEIIDLGGLYSPHSTADEEDIPIDDIKTASDLPETHAKTRTRRFPR